MLRSMIYYSGLALGLMKNMLWAPACVSLKKHGRIKEYDALTYKVISRWGRHRVKAAGVKINVQGLENVPKDRTVLFIANHQSNFDIPVLIGCVPVPKGFVAKKELENVPLLSYWMKHIHCLFMDRNDMKQSMKIIMQTIQQLKDGYSMVIFPEGTRSKGKPVAEFKAGSFKPALKAGVPIVPITIDGTYLAMEGNPHNRIRPADVNLVIHPLIETKDLTKEEIIELPSRVRTIIVDCMTKTPKE